MTRRKPNPQRKPQSHQRMVVTPKAERLLGKTPNELTRDQALKAAAFDWTLPKYQQSREAFYEAIHEREKVLHRLNTSLADQFSGGVFSGERGRQWS